MHPTAPASPAKARFQVPELRRAGAGPAGRLGARCAFEAVDAVGALVDVVPGAGALRATAAAGVAEALGPGTGLVRVAAGTAGGGEPAGSPAAGSPDAATGDTVGAEHAVLAARMKQITPIVPSPRVRGRTARPPSRVPRGDGRCACLGQRS